MNEGWKKEGRKEEKEREGKKVKEWYQHKMKLTQKHKFS